MINFLKKIYPYTISLVCIMMVLIHAADQKELSNQKDITEAHREYSNHQLHVVYLLKHIIETKDFAIASFPGYPPENIYFGNLTMSGDYLTASNSLFICIGDFEYAININAASNVLVSDNFIESR